MACYILISLTHYYVSWKQAHLWWPLLSEMAYRLHMVRIHLDRISRWVVALAFSSTVEQWNIPVAAYWNTLGTLCRYIQSRYISIMLTTYINRPNGCSQGKPGLTSSSSVFFIISSWNKTFKDTWHRRFMGQWPSCHLTEN